MSAENPGDPNVGPSTVASGPDQISQALMPLGYLCGGVAFIIWPIILGLLAIIFGAVVLRRGGKEHGEKMMGLGLFGLVGGLVIGWLFPGASADPAYVKECRSLWDRQSRGYPAVDVSYKRVGNGELTRYGNDRVVGYYTDFIIMLKFDNFGKQGQINLQCVANVQKTFTYMKTDDPNWIGGRPGPIGVSFYLANGKPSLSPPSLD